MNLPIQTNLSAQHEQEPVAGTVEAMRNKAKQIIGYRGRLPRSMSTPPKGCKNPEGFREWCTPLCKTRSEAVTLLNAVVQQINTPGSISRGRAFADSAAHNIQERMQKSLRRVNNPIAAAKRIQSWANMTKNWLPKAQFWEWPPAAIRLEDFQAFVDWLSTKARHRNGDALSNSLVRNIAQQVRAVFRQAGVNPEASKRVTLPPRDKSKVPNMTLDQQNRFFSCQKIPEKDRVMAGIGMGLALRVGELLACERLQVTRTSATRGFAIVEYGGDHHSPLKGKGENKTRRIELHEPGLGFLEIWLRDHYRGGVRLFDGPNGGYMSHWACGWKKWSKFVERPMHSHLMRHTYAVSMLSGTWGYPKQPLEFIKQQLGHTELRTTEKYYADYHEGSFARGVDQMVGSADGSTPKAEPVIVTAVALLNGTAGLVSGPSGGGEGGKNPDETQVSREKGDDRWSSAAFPGKPEENEQKPAHARPLCQPATSVAFQGRSFAPRRRRRGIA